MNQEIAPLRILLRAFPGIPLSEIKALIESGEMCSYPESTVLCHEDAYETTFYIILDGEVQVTKVINPDKDQVRVLKNLGTGDFFGEMALVQDAPRAATVTTTIPTTVLEIRKEYFNQLLRSSASLSRAMMNEVVRRLRENDAMAIEDLRLKAGELASAYQQLAEQEFARREFLTVIAHELRTPLTSASGFLQMIEKGLMQGQRLDSEVQQAAIRSASRNIQQIVSLINDILFIQEMDLIMTHFEPISLHTVLETVVERCRKRMQENRIEVSLELPAHLPMVSGDGRSLERAFDAILDNAIKFSHEGGKVEIFSGRANKRVWIKICDHGVGIPENVLPRIFERFFHVDQIEGKMYRGVGLGLSIARQVIEQHDGNIEVTSTPKEGTIVTVSLNTTG